MKPETRRPRRPRLIGYARISRPEQRLASQIDALVKAGVRAGDIYSDKASGARIDRPGLAEALAAARKGDTLVVWKLDRLGRQLLHLLQLARDLDLRGVRLRSLTQDIDPSTASGRLMYNILALVAEMERDLIRERTLAGLAHARRVGHRPGRRPMPRRELARHTAEVRRLLRQGMTMVGIARHLGVARSTAYLWREGVAHA